MRHMLRDLDEGVTIHEATSFSEALVIAKEQPEIRLILLDLLMPDMAPYDGIAALRERAPHAVLIVVSMIDDRREAIRSIEAGALGYLPKKSSREEMAKAVKMVLSGDVYLPRELLDQSSFSGGMMSRSTTTGVPDPRLSKLTKRQRDVLQLLGEGQSNAQIARTLGISEYTVRLHVSAVLKKLEVRNRTQAALIVRGDAPRQRVC